MDNKLTLKPARALRIKILKFNENLTKDRLHLQKLSKSAPIKNCDNFERMLMYGNHEMATINHF